MIGFALLYCKLYGLFVRFIIYTRRVGWGEGWGGGGRVKVRSWGERLLRRGGYTRSCTSWKDSDLFNDCAMLFAQRVFLVFDNKGFLTYQYIPSKWGVFFFDKAGLEVEADICHFESPDVS